MTSENPNGMWAERREYPRIKANCPVRYQINSEGEWHEATLLDYSATGAHIRCDELMLKGTKVRIEVIPGCVKNVPQFSAEGTVVRYTIDDEHRYLLGCQFQKAISTLINNQVN